LSSFWQNAIFSHFPETHTAVYVDGLVNNASAGPNKFWTVEMAISFKDFLVNCTIATTPPKNRDIWRINFSRVEYNVTVVNGRYQKVPGLPEQNWVWSPQWTINMHLPERWGFVQWSDQAVNRSQ